MSYNKLVRDNIPEIIKANGETPIIITLDEITFLKELTKKLEEEMLELQEAIKLNDKEKIIEESADLLEVVRAINNNDLTSVISKMNDKREKRGGFEKRIYLKGVKK